MLKPILAFLLLAGFLAKPILLCADTPLSKPSIVSTIAQHCPQCPQRMSDSTAAYILEYGEEALLSRAWLVDNAQTSIDIQYFIWSTDNIGILASEALLRAAERGVKVRVLVDDLLIDADNEMLVALDAHPNIAIKIYNPKHSVGVSTLQRMLNVVTDFRGVNQRMHDKTAMIDNAVGITGGRNMADEYFDYDQEYNFRDRDVLLMGKVVDEMTANFDEFWQHPLSVSVSTQLEQDQRVLTEEQRLLRFDELHRYASEEVHFENSVRTRITALPNYFPNLIESMVWGDVHFISDKPGKNDGNRGLGGGGESTGELIDLVTSAQRSVVIQSPYLIVPDDGIRVLKALVDRGVEVTIVTNSLASTDNLMAFSGYYKQRQALMDAGVQVFEFKPHPAIQEALNERYPRLQDNNPIFAIHAKSMVVDGSTLYIGTFNLDPRSANLNTEVGALIRNDQLASQLERTILSDTKADNSWKITAEFNPDNVASLDKRIKVWLLSWLPLKPVL